MITITKEVTINWHNLELDGPPPMNTFFPLLLITPEGLRTGRYMGADYEPAPNSGQTVVEGFLRGGWYFTAVTHWAYMNDILRPFTEDAMLFPKLLQVHDGMEYMTGNVFPNGATLIGGEVEERGHDGFAIMPAADEQ